MYIFNKFPLMLILILPAWTAHFENHCASSFANFSYIVSAFSLPTSNADYLNFKKKNKQSTSICNHINKPQNAMMS